MVSNSTNSLETKREQAIALCEQVINQANANKMDLSQWHGMPSGNPVDIATALTNVFLSDYCQRLRDWLTQASEENLAKHIDNIIGALYTYTNVNICLMQHLSQNHMFVPFPDIVPYSFIAGTCWSYGDVLGNVKRIFNPNF